MISLTRYYLLRLSRSQWTMFVAFGLVCPLQHRLIFELTPGFMRIITMSSAVMMMAGFAGIAGACLYGRDEADLSLPFDRGQVHRCRLAAWLLATAALYLMAERQFVRNEVPFIAKGREDLREQSV